MKPGLGLSLQQNVCHEVNKLGTAGPRPADFSMDRPIRLVGRPLEITVPTFIAVSLEPPEPKRVRQWFVGFLLGFARKQCR